MQNILLNRRLGALLIGLLVGGSLLLLWQGNFFRSAQLALTNLSFVADEARSLGPLAEGTIICLFAMLSSWAYVYLSWLQKLALAAFLLLLSLVFSFISYSGSYGIIPMFYPMLALILPLIAHIALDSSREIALRRQTDSLLQSLGELTQQRLQLDIILPRIAKDVQSLLPEAVGAIYLRQRPELPLRRAYHWPLGLKEDDYQDFISEIDRSRKSKRQGGNLALPIVAQGQIRGVFLVAHEDVQRHEKLLSDYVSRLTPTLEITLLYEEVTRQRSTLSTLLANTPSAVLVLDSHYRVVMYNESAASLLQSQAKTLRERPLADALAALGVEADAQTLLLAKMKESVAFQHDLSIGEESYKLDAALILSLQQWVFVLSNITELVELSKLKTRMLRMASHDLKNPLGRIIGYAQLLQSQPEMDEKSLKFLKNIEDSSEEMNQLISILLDVERMRSGNIQREAFELRQVVQQIIGRHEPDTLQKQQLYEAEILSEELPMQGDLRQLSQVISNLIGNAIKYTPIEGKISVRLKREGKQAVFEVQDNGYGIPKEAQANLFTEFYRVRTKDTAGISGTGLGLSFVKTVVEAHGGIVGLESEEGKGSRFYFKLPMQNGK
jgi:signal transduction histidine kinase